MFRVTPKSVNSVKKYAPKSATLNKFLNSEDAVFNENFG